MGTIRYPLGTQVQGRVAGGWARRPDASSDPASDGCFCFPSPWAKAAGARSKLQLVFIASRLKKGLSIFLERRGKKNIFFPDPIGGLAPIFHLLSLLGGANQEISLPEDPGDSGS